MKVLVYFEQEFYSTEGKYDFRTLENVSHVFECSSNEDLLKQFEAYNFIPRHIKFLYGKSEVLFGKRTMIWYLPENNQANIVDEKDEVCAA